MLVSLVLASRDLTARRCPRVPPCRARGRHARLRRAGQAVADLPDGRTARAAGTRSPPTGRPIQRLTGDRAAVAGVIIAGGCTGICFVLNAASLAVLSCLAFIRPDQLPRSSETLGADRRRHAAGALFVRHDPEPGLVLAVVAIVSTVGFNFHVLVPLLAGETLQVGPEGFGAALPRSDWARWTAPPRRRRSVAATRRLFATGGAGSGVLALALAPVQNALLGVLLFVAGIGFTLFTANANALVQLGRRTGCAAVSSASTSSPSPALRRSEGSSRAGSPRSGDDARVRRRRWRRRSRLPGRARPALTSADSSRPAA